MRKIKPKNYSKSTSGKFHGSTKVINAKPGTIIEIDNSSLGCCALVSDSSTGEILWRNRSGFMPSLEMPYEKFNNMKDFKKWVHNERNRYIKR